MIGWLKQTIQSTRWGGQSLICLFVSVLSGIVLALQYVPATPFYTTSTIALVVPYGQFWRGLHYYSSQAFFLLLAIHTAVVVWRNDHRLARRAWIRLTATIPVGLLLLFTGYVLRGDATGEAAGAIAEHITLSMPLAGKILNDLLFDIQAAGVHKVYVQHLIGLIVLGGWCLWPHLKRYGAKFSDHLLLIALLLTISLFLPAPMEPDHVGLIHIAGPWFFLGLQELLRTIPPFWAGIVVPASLMLALFFLPEKGRPRRMAVLAIVLWLAAYLIVTLISLSRFQA